MFNLLVLDRGRRAFLPVLAGGLLPDLPMFVFYGFHKLVVGMPEAVIWREAYYAPGWQAVIDLPNSLPLLALAGLLSYRAGAHGWTWLFGSMALHALSDLPLHAGDAHRHFWPLSDWRFESPVSYWDPAHFGRYVGLGELALLVGGTVLLCRRYTERPRRIAVLLAAGTYAAGLLYALVIWA